MALKGFKLSLGSLVGAGTWKALSPVFLDINSRSPEKYL